LAPAIANPKEDDVADDVRDEHVTQTQKAGCVDEAGDDGEQHEQRRQRPVAVVPQRA